MYGEDIDLSWRIIQGGYQNYYFPETTIIHYKGESTKKGSLNYVRVFYNAMILFARKHFGSGKANFFVLLLQLGIYFRATLTIISNGMKKLVWPTIDTVTMLLGLEVAKTFWANYHFQNPDYYKPEFYQVNAPLYCFIWLISIFFSGGYDRPFSRWKLIRGIAFGTLLLAAVYGFLNMEYRNSRAIIALGAAWVMAGTLLTRYLGHFFKTGTFRLETNKEQRVMIVGSEQEASRVRQLILESGIPKDIIGRVQPQSEARATTSLGSIQSLDDLVSIYQITEIVFCLRDIPSQEVLKWMSILGPNMLYKTVASDSLTIVGSQSKNSNGELYTIQLQFAISQPANRRNKRVFECLLSPFLILLGLIHLPIKGSATLKASFAILFGKQSLVGYSGQRPENLPNIKPGLLNPLDGIDRSITDSKTIDRLNMLYAKDYKPEVDLTIFWKWLWRK